MTPGEPKASQGKRDNSPKISLSLEELFGAEGDELAVLSVCAARVDADDAWTLAHGTFLVVPQRCAEISWPE